MDWVIKMFEIDIQIQATSFKSCYNATNGNYYSKTEFNQDLCDYLSPGRTIKSSNFPWLLSAWSQCRPFPSLLYKGFTEHCSVKKTAGSSQENQNCLNRSLNSSKLQSMSAFSLHINCNNSRLALNPSKWSLSLIVVWLICNSLRGKLKLFIRILICESEAFEDNKLWKL